MIRRFLSFVDSFIPKDRAQGIDGAHWWGWFKPELATKPIDFIIVKATQDHIWVDPLFDENALAAMQIDMRGAYHYQKLFISWLAQAEHFLRQASKYDFHIYALDVEKIGNESAFTNQAHGEMFVSDMRRIIDYWRIKAPSKSVWLYTNTDIYKTLIVPTLKRLYGAEGLQWLESVPLWLAEYNGLFPHGEPSLPGWTVWQGSDRGRKEDYGTNGAVDLNVYKGTKSEMLAWLGLSEDPTPEPEPEEPIMTQGRVLRTTNIRNAAGVTTTGSDIGDLYEGDIVTWDRAPLVGSVTWYHLTNATRNGQPIITLGGLNVSQRTDCWAYGVNIEPIPGTPTPTPTLPVVNVTVSGEGYETVIVELRPL